MNEILNLMRTAVILDRYFKENYGFIQVKESEK